MALRAKLPVGGGAHCSQPGESLVGRRNALQ